MLMGAVQQSEDAGAQLCRLGTIIPATGGRPRRANLGSGCQPLRTISQVTVERARWSPAAIAAGLQRNTNCV